MKRGEKEFDRLKELALYKMNLPENVAKGWPKKEQIFETLSSLDAEVDELFDAIEKNTKSDCFRRGLKLDENIEFKEDADFKSIKLEIADVAAYCALLLDVIEQNKKEKYFDVQESGRVFNSFLERMIKGSNAMDTFIDRVKILRKDTPNSSYLNLSIDTLCKDLEELRKLLNENAPEATVEPIMGQIKKGIEMLSKIIEQHGIIERHGHGLG